MNQINFMAWCNVDKAMYYQVQNGISFEDGSRYEFSDFLNRDDYHQWELYQFTGLKDKNGEDIYDGHIILEQNSFMGSDFKGLIEYSDDGFKWIVNDKPFNQRYGRYAENTYLSAFHSDQIEIIGHKCTHPELFG